MNRILKTFLPLVAALLVVQAVSAAPVTIKLASIAPQNTPWGSELDNLAKEWATVTNGQVKLVIYHNGAAGDEANMLRQMRLGQLQGCVFTSFGLNLITPEILTLSAPFLVRTNDELDYVLAKNRDYFEGLLNKQGVRTIGWSKAGWVRFFSRKPAIVPGDLKSQKLAIDPTVPTLMQAFKELGYQLVPVSLTDTITALSSGIVDSAYTSPLAAGGMQIFGIAKHMSSFKLSPFLGAIVLSERAWNKIPADLRPKLEATCKAMEKRLENKFAPLEDDAIVTMKKYGLIEDSITPEQLALWIKDVETSIPKSFGTAFDKKTYEMIYAQLTEFRGKKK